MQSHVYCIQAKVSHIASVQEMARLGRLGQLFTLYPHSYWLHASNYIQHKDHC